LIRELILNKQKLIELCHEYNIKEQERQHENRMNMLENFSDYDMQSERLFINTRLIKQKDNSELDITYSESEISKR